MEWRTENGLIREEILKTGLYDVVMGNPVITLAVMCIFAGDNHHSPQRALFRLGMRSTPIECCRTRG